MRDSCRKGKEREREREREREDGGKAKAIGGGKKKRQIKRGLNAICPALKAANGRDDHEGMLKGGF